MTSAECLSSEELIKKQSIHKYTQCKGPYDMITSVAIPLPYCEFVYLSKQIYMRMCVIFYSGTRDL